MRKICAALAAIISTAGCAYGQTMPLAVYVQRANGTIVGWAAQPQPDPSFDRSPTSAADPALSAWASGQAAQTLATASLANTMASGLTVTCADNATICSGDIAGTYGVGQQAQTDLAAIVTGLAGNQGLPGGGTTMIYMDATNQPRIFTAPQITALAKAIRDYVYAAKIAAALAAAGQPASWPSAIITIP